MMYKVIYVEKYVPRILVRIVGIFYENFQLEKSPKIDWIL